MKNKVLKVTLHNYVSDEYDQLNHVVKIEWNRDKAQYEITSSIEEENAVYNRLWTIVKVEL